MPSRLTDPSVALSIPFIFEIGKNVSTVSENTSIPLTYIVYVLSLESDTNTSVFSTACPLCFPHNEAGLENK